MPSTMSEPVEARTITRGMPSSRAVRAAVSTTDDVADDSGTPRKPDDVRPPNSTQTTRRSPIGVTTGGDGVVDAPLDPERRRGHWHDPTCGAVATASVP